MKKIDRAAIREWLRMTPSERLDALQRQADARATRQPARVAEEPPDDPAPPMKFFGEELQASPSTVPMLFPDPVIEVYMKDVDRGLLRQALRLSVSDRFERFQRLSEGAGALRRACARESA